MAECKAQALRVRAWQKPSFALTRNFFIQNRADRSRKGYKIQKAYDVGFSSILDGSFISAGMY